MAVRRGFGDPLADAQAALRGGGQVDVNTLLTATQLDPATVQAQAQAAVGQMTSDLQAKWDGATSQAANDARISQGTIAASSLVQNGYDPHSAADNQQLVFAIAGAVSLVPAVGPMLGGALILLDQLGQAIGGLLEKAGIIWYGCRTSGNWTPAAVLDYVRAQGAQTTINGVPQGLPAMMPGSFAVLALPMLAANAAKIGNCQAGLHNAQVLATAAAMWNANSSGPPMGVYVPALSDDGSPQIFAVSAQVPYAFQQATDINQYPNSGPLNPFPTNSLTSSNNQTPAFILQLSGSTFGAKTTTSSSSAGSKVATAAVAGAATLGVGTLVYAWVAGHSIDSVMGAAWRAAKKFFYHVAGEAEHLTENPLGLLERQSTTVQAILFPRPEYTPSRARSWARKHGYRAGKVHSTGDYVRLRQRPPGEFKRGSFRTISFGRSGIRAVIGHLR
jgi:hypothetical protein